MFETCVISLQKSLRLHHVRIGDLELKLARFDTDNRAPIGTVEVYSPRNDTWTQIKPLNRARRRFGIAEVDGTIFVAGGFSEDSVEYYNPLSNQWVVLEGVKVDRYDISCFALPLPQCLCATLQDHM
ncbi:predicted protein [Nematostella vectensis]|uniref:Uncharacterized protein n=1 Tax=Nematostella vectensis TaxID=45351 RepID=A7RV86_NEMVE|nr:predicted protein [Nematostella vectensis]|eukprot:XP_001636592.1 predicted protein [Nematostella vectensis]